MAKYSIFISSVQKELAEERQALKAYVEGDALLSRFFEVFLFEQLPAADRRADRVYLDQVDRCDLYLGLFGDEYGYEDAAGISPTAREFNRATERGKSRRLLGPRWNQAWIAAHSEAPYHGAVGAPGMQRLFAHRHYRIDITIPTGASTISVPPLSE